MRRRFVMGVAVLLAVLAGGLLAFAAVLVAFVHLPGIEDWRRKTIEDRLTAVWGEPVTVSGDISLQLWPRPALRLKDVASTTDGRAPAKAAELRLLLARWWRLPVDPLLFAVGVDDGTFEFALKPNAKAAPGTLLSSPVAFFSVLPRLRLRNVTFDFADPEDNWRFRLEVERVLSRLQGGIEYLDAAAKLNGAPLTLAFEFDREPRPPEPGALPYGALISMTGPGLSASLRTRSARPTFDDNLTMVLSATSSSIGDLLAVAGIARTVDGTGSLSTHLLTDPQTISARGLALDLDFNTGIRTRFTGTIGDVLTGRGVDVMASADIEPDAAPAQSLIDVTVTRLSGRFHDGEAGLMMSEAVLETNAFSQNLRDIGPISVASIKRREDGRVALVGISVQGRPGPDPLFHLTGDVLDTLALKDLALAGDFNLPVSDVLDVPAQAADKLGRLVGEASLTDSGGVLQLESFTAELRESDLISARMRLRPPKEEDEVASAMEAKLDIDRLGPLVRALGSNTRFAGGLSFDGVFERRRDGVRSSGRLGLGDTRVEGALTAQVKEKRPLISGRITSPRIHTDQLGTLLYDTPDAPPPRVGIAGVRMAPDRSLDLARAIDLDVEVRAERIEGGGASASNLDARLRLTKGTVRAEPVSLNVGRGRVRMAVTEADAGKMRVKGSGEGWPLAEISGGSKYIRSGTASATFDVTASFEPGRNPVTTLDGVVTGAVRDAELGTGMLDLAGLGVIGGLFNSAVLSGQSVLRCARIPLRFSDGVGRADPAIVLETDNVQAVARGTVNVVRETLDLAVTPRPLNGGPNGYSFTVRGPFAAPDVALGSGRAGPAPQVAGCRG